MSIDPLIHSYRLTVFIHAPSSDLSMSLQGDAVVVAQIRLGPAHDLAATYPSGGSRSSTPPGSSVYHDERMHTACDGQYTVLVSTVLPHLAVGAVERARCESPRPVLSRRLRLPLPSSRRHALSLCARAQIFHASHQQYSPQTSTTSTGRVKDPHARKVYSARLTSSGGRGCCLRCSGMDAWTLRDADGADRECEEGVVAVGMTPLRHAAASLVLSVCTDGGDTRWRDVRSALPGFCIAGADPVASALLCRSTAALPRHGRRRAAFATAFFLSLRCSDTRGYALIVKAEAA
ncbi:hypothetical protein R3P38DRAFT_3215538 [Favolaschia claudopus]|uniref:Uncharacterized protein n=1 Tax=Favolaschia claudopus TaxID=2862362 RepID=A0AAW0A7X2_9AGAR